MNSTVALKVKHNITLLCFLSCCVFFKCWYVFWNVTVFSLMLVCFLKCFVKVFQGYHIVALSIGQTISATKSPILVATKNFYQIYRFVIQLWMSWVFIFNKKLTHDCHCFGSIGRYTRDLPRYIVDSLVESAFSVWARASGLTFVRSHTRSADIMVEFVTSGGFSLIAQIEHAWEWIFAA